MNAPVERNGNLHFHLAALDRPIEWVKDAATVTTGGTIASLALLDYIRGVEGVIAGALTIAILLFRLRRHVRGNRVPDNRP